MTPPTRSARLLRVGHDDGRPREVVGVRPRARGVLERGAVGRLVDREGGRLDHEERHTGGVGLGFWVWDEWNNLKVENILIAILVIGVIGLMLEHALLLVAKRWQYD